MQLASKVALITGAGSGFGRASAQLFAREDCKVVVVDLREDVGRETVSTIQADGGEASFVRADVDEARRAAMASVPLGRLAQADDVAYAALYLASDNASMVTGINLEVDGGRDL